MVNEAYFRREIYRMLRYTYDLWPDHFPDIKGIKKQPGRPDLVVMNPRGPGFYVEVKVHRANKNTSFSFTEISEGQRRWLSEWEKVRSGGSYLALGVVGIRPRRGYLIPWPMWLYVEELITPFQNSLPHEVRPGMLKEVQERHLDFRLIKDWELRRVSGGWEIENELYSIK